MLSALPECHLPIPPALLRPLAPILAFIRSGSAGGTMLMLSGVVALIWTNSPRQPYYEALLHFVPVVWAGLDVHLWINDGLMAVFFLLVGLELRREITAGELASARRLAAPALGALGGMILPALIFVAFNYRDPAALHGWAVPVATDIAFALAVIAVLGRRVPVALKIFLTALAIIDDLGAILVIAVFYAKALDWGALASAGGVLAVLYGLNQAGVRRLSIYLLAGAVLWVLVFRSGVHATLAGVATALAVPTGVARRLEHALNPIVGFVVLPLFGLFNAGLDLSSIGFETLRDPVVPGIFFGLFVGKQIGVFGALRVAVAAGLARVPAGLSWPQLYGAATLCGIGFTMSLFIGNLSFTDGTRTTELKLAVFAASIISAIMGASILWFASRKVMVESAHVAH